MGRNTEVHTKNIQFTLAVDETPPSGLDIKHCHDDYEFLLIIKGRGKYVIEGVEIPVCPGTLVLARPLEYHCIKINPGEQYERYRIHLNASAIPSEVLPVFEETLRPGSVSAYTALAFSESLVSLFERFLFSANLPEERREIYMKLLISELVMLLSVSAKELYSADEDELGVRVIKYLNENIDKNVSLDKLAKRFFVSKYYLCRAFKKHNGISVHGYVNKKRVMLAKQMIESGETASGAAYRVGFGDYSAFYRAYVKAVGEPPSVKGAKGKFEGEENGI